MKHEFDGKGTPGNGGVRAPFATFSVGCCELVPRASGKGTKFGKAKVRVTGPASRTLDVYRKASEICAQLNAGTYTGPKNVRVK